MATSFDEENQRSKSPVSAANAHNSHVNPSYPDRSHGSFEKSRDPRPYGGFFDNRRERAAETSDSWRRETPIPQKVVMDEVEPPIKVSSILRKPKESPDTERFPLSSTIKNEDHSKVSEDTNTESSSVSENIPRRILQNSDKVKLNTSIQNTLIQTSSDTSPALTPITNSSGPGPAHSHSSNNRAHSQTHHVHRSPRTSSPATSKTKISVSDFDAVMSNIKNLMTAGTLNNNNNNNNNNSKPVDLVLKVNEVKEEKTLKEVDAGGSHLSALPPPPTSITTPTKSISGNSADKPSFKPHSRAKSDAVDNWRARSKSKDSSDVDSFPLESTSTIAQTTLKEDESLLPLPPPPPPPPTISTVLPNPPTPTLPASTASSKVKSPVPGSSTVSTPQQVLQRRLSREEVPNSAKNASFSYPFPPHAWSSMYATQNVEDYLNAYNRHSVNEEKNGNKDVFMYTNAVPGICPAVVHHGKKKNA
jgi:hypothetical protein